MLEVKIETDEENKWQHVNVLTVLHNGEVICEEYDHGEPEDNSFNRDYSWVSPLIKKVYNLGRQDGQRDCQMSGIGF